MPRCVVCDHCSETGDGLRGYTWVPEIVGYHCSKCITSISNANFELAEEKKIEDGEIANVWIDPEFDFIEPTGKSYHMERAKILGVPGVGPDTGETTD